MEIMRSGYSSNGYGNCWIESHGTYFVVYVMNGKSKYGPYSNLEDAIREYSRYCS